MVKPKGKGPTGNVALSGHEPGQEIQQKREVYLHGRRKGRRKKGQGGVPREDTREKKPWVVCGGRGIGEEKGQRPFFRGGW